MSESAPSRLPEEAAEEAVKAYVRRNRARLQADGELLSLLLPERFDSDGVTDLQHYALERLRAENRALRAERDGLKANAVQGARLSEGVRRAVLDLIAARGFAEVVAVAEKSAAAFDADRAVLCLEGDEALAHGSVRRVAQGTVAAVVGPDGMGAILSGGGELLIGRTGYRSLAAFRLRLAGGPALYVLGSAAEGRFEGQDSEADLGFFARALERTIRLWLDPPQA